jgi:protein TonB
MSDLGSFSQCLVDGDVQALERARKLRRKAQAASISLEAALVAAMLLWPLITPGVLPQPFFVTPTVPYHGGGGNTSPAPSRGSAHHSPENIHSTIRLSIMQPPSIPAHAQTNLAEEAPGGSLGPGFGSANVPGGGTGMGGDSIPGGSDLVKPPMWIKPPATPQKPRPISEGVMQAELIHKVQPEYPAAARTMHMAGTVRLRAIIAKDGSVQELEVVSGNPILVRAALAAVSEWCYRPTQLNGEFVEVETYITVNFVLDQSGKKKRLQRRRSCGVPATVR